MIITTEEMYEIFNTINTKNNIITRESPFIFYKCANRTSYILFFLFSHSHHISQISYSIKYHQIYQYKRITMGKTMV